MATCGSPSWVGAFTFVVLCAIDIGIDALEEKRRRGTSLLPRGGVRFRSASRLREH